MARGLFISFEGIDGCGKSTQIKRLAARIGAFRPVVESAEPGGTEIGSQIRRVLLDARNQSLSPVAELLLYFACRAQNVDERIHPALENGAVVLSDRFTDSSVVYQGLGRGLGAETVLDVDRIACRGLKPDLTVLLDIDLETGLQRARARNVETASTETRMDDQVNEFHQRARDGYHALAAAEPERFLVIDGRGDPESVAALVWAAVEPHVR